MDSLNDLPLDSAARYSRLDEAAQQTLKRLQPLLARPPHDLLAILLGRGDDTKSPVEWPSPSLSVAQTSHDE